MNSTDEMDLTAFIHECRRLCIGRMPEAKTILHVGANASWYFEWFKNCYKYTINKQIGIDILPRPVDLPGDIQWIQSDASNLSQIDSQSIDLVYAGQFIEHIPWDSQANFLQAVHRVLVPGGILVFDSPNFQITNPYGWSKGGDHISELSFPQIIDILHIAGYEIIDTYGILPTQLMGEPKKKYGKYLDNEWNINFYRRDIKNGVVDDAGRAFIWWIVCRKAQVNPDREKLCAQLRTYYLANEAAKLKVALHQIGFINELDNDYYIDLHSKESGFTLYGPYKTYNPGEYRVEFNLVLSEEGAIDPNVPIATIDVSTGIEGNIIRKRDLKLKDMKVAACQGLEFRIDAPAILQFRVFSHGTAKFKTGLSPVLSKLN